ncbi:hypothetical protein KC19_6G085700 [Ceratodon purpureus]|uniref:DUF7796 domain-containing protein n=1 Tax=Ceratodon purpureus TaxID=3225 RepID=A0A8T0HGX0_CERPU|nr:hypothetical protein KC19_6G085700 [Ceratodon purpureus]
MGWWKVNELRLRLWLPWMIMVAAGLLTYGYYQFLDPQNCANIFFGCSIISFTPNFTPNASPLPPPPTPSLNVTTFLYNDTRRIAVCLVGGARMFEITGRTIRKNLLDAYPNTDVFLHSPLDKDSHKLTLLAGRNLRAARIFTPTPIPETRITTEVITSWGSPAGLQGLLQYFNLVEGCYGMVKQYEVRHHIKYDWIIRTRVDGYWSHPIPNITDLDPKFYYVAAGSDFRGLNDRFGMGNAHASRAANSRLSLLPLMHQRGLRGLNSESAYKAQLEVSQVPYHRIQVPFCVMTLRKMAHPPPPYGLLLLSMASKGPMSGTYCRPCEKEANATYSAAIVDGCMRNWDWPGIGGSEVTVCDGREPWAENWREVAEKVYKKDIGEEIRSFNETRGMEACVSEMREFEMMWEVWDSPPAETICKRALSKK